MWFKVDDGFHSSKKLLMIPRAHRLAAAGLWVIAGSWCGNHLTDGLVPDYMIDEWGSTPELVEWLVRVGLWEHVADNSTRFAKWDEYQPTKDEVESKRTFERERKRKQRRGPGGKFESSDCPSGTPSGTPTGTPGGVTPESHRPDPTRPDPTNVGGLRRKPERPLPPDWQPDDTHRAYAAKEGIDVDYQAERFRNHAQANDRRARDWDAAFRNWLLKAEKSQTLGFDPWSTNGAHA